MKPSNRLSIDYTSEATTFRKIRGGIVDIHSHIHGEAATQIYATAAQHYGVSLTYSMTPLAEIPVVKKLLGDAVAFIAIPEFNRRDLDAAIGARFIKDLHEYRSHGAMIAKFWSAPRIYDASDEPFSRNPFRINSPLRMDTMKAAADLGMILMAHIADPDTWFQTKYRDERKYGTKHQQYELFEDVLARFPVPWIAAHMGGYPEDLDFLSRLLLEHPNLHLDCSATRWIVRELSKHQPQHLRDFFERWRGRILFGSDIVTLDAHLSSDQNDGEMSSKASSHAEAYDLYASRYWVLRTLFETSYCGESPIADPDLHLVNPEQHTPHDAPMLRGCTLSEDVALDLYRGAAIRLGLGNKTD